jgi:hypothetical protein
VSVEVMTRDDGICRDVLERIAARIAATPRTARVRAVGVIAVARYLDEWGRRRDGMRVSTEAVSQIAAGTLMAAGTVRKALAILDAAGATETITRGGGHGPTARGSVRRLRLSEAENCARCDPELRAPERAELNGSTARATTSTARATTSTARAQARDSALFRSSSKDAGARETEPGSMWADDSDVVGTPPPYRETIAAIRAQLGNDGSPWMDALLAREGPFAEVAPIEDHRPTPAPPQLGDVPWIAEGVTHAEWRQREVAAGRVPRTGYRRAE